MGPTYFQDNKDHSVITRVAEEDGRLTAYTFSTAFQLNQYAEEYKLLIFLFNSLYSSAY